MHTRSLATYALIFATVAAPALGQAVAEIYVDTPPPPPRSETVPPARTGFVWAPGYWSWDGNQHVWVEGRWLETRVNAKWEPEHWEQVDGRWHFVPGQWVTN